MNNPSISSQSQRSSSRSSFLACAVAIDAPLRDLLSGFDTTRDLLKVQLARIDHSYKHDVFSHRSGDNLRQPRAVMPMQPEETVDLHLARFDHQSNVGTNMHRPDTRLATGKDDGSSFEL